MDNCRFTISLCGSNFFGYDSVDKTVEFLTVNDLDRLYLHYGCDYYKHGVIDADDAVMARLLMCGGDSHVIYMDSMYKLWCELHNLYWNLYLGLINSDTELCFAVSDRPRDAVNWTLGYRVAYMEVPDGYITYLCSRDADVKREVCNLVNHTSFRWRDRYNRYCSGIGLKDYPRRK